MILTAVLLIALAIVLLVLWREFRFIGAEADDLNSAEGRSARRALPGNFLPSKLAGGVICQEPSPALPFKSAALSKAPQKRSGGRAGSLNASGLPAAFSHADAEGAEAKHAVDDLADSFEGLPPLKAQSARLRFGSGFGLSLHAEQSKRGDVASEQKSFAAGAKRV